MKQCDSYEEAVTCLLDTPKFTTKNPMGATRAFYEYLGCPGSESHIIHVAGTNGKGSVCAYMERILTKAGYRTALFTSPHLVDIRERMRVDFEMISKEDFLREYRLLCDFVASYQARTSYEPTFFEILFFMGMLWFKEQKTDFIVLETGLGGRLDATNVVAEPVMCIITEVGLDHMEYLGDTVSEIAGEKAGIVKQGVPLVALSGGTDTDPVYEAACREQNAELYLVPETVSSEVCFGENGIDFSFVYRYYKYAGLHIGSTAAYQVTNASLAVAAASILSKRFKVPTEAIYAGLSEMVWEGRMEELMPGLFVDGAHNIPGIHAFLQAVSHDGCTERALIFAAVRDKAYPEMISDIVSSGLFTKACITEISGSRNLEVEKMREEFIHNGFSDICICEQPREALLYAMDLARSGIRCYIAGSLYLVGMMKECFCRLASTDIGGEEHD